MTTMTAGEKLRTARMNHRPGGVDYINKMIESPIELHGDRRFGDDLAIVGGVGFLSGIPVTYIATDKGNDLSERIERNFGCPKPEGYRKALRLMKQAEKFGRPVICFVDTQGAWCGADAEERGQGEAIAECIQTMMGLKVPVISVLTGEGGSGGALALAAADRVYMLENAVYSVISPEGCASILWKDSSKVEEAASALHITAQDMKNFGVADEVIHEDFEHFDSMCESLEKLIADELSKLMRSSGAVLAEGRYERFRKFGMFGN